MIFVFCFSKKQRKTMEFTELMCLIVCDKLFSNRDRVPTHDMLEEILVEYKHWWTQRIFIIGGSSDDNFHECYVLHLGKGRTYSSQFYPIYVRDHKSAVLPDGSVITTGGYRKSRDWEAGSDDWSSTNLCFLFNKHFISTTSMKEARHGHALAALRDGRVFAFGGRHIINGGGRALDSVEFYDLKTRAWEINRRPLPVTCEYLVAVVLGNSTVLISGGRDKSSATSACYIFDPIRNTFTMCARMYDPRENHAGVLLPDGQVLVSGGVNMTGLLRTCELYDPVADRWKRTHTIRYARQGHACVLLAKFVMIFGAQHTYGDYSAKVEMFSLDHHKWQTSTIITRNMTSSSVVVLPPSCLVAQQNEFI